MRSKFWWVAWALLAGCAPSPHIKAPSPEAPAAAPATKPTEAPAPSRYRLVSVEVFGSRRYSREEVLAVFGVPEGRDVDLSGVRHEAKQGKERLLSRFAFAQVRVGITNYEDTHTVEVMVSLVDIGDEWRLDFAPKPDGTPEDPEGLVAAWAAYEEQAGKLYRAGAMPVGDGSCRAFHCGAGFGHPTLAPLEARFITGVPAHFEALVKVLRTEKDEYRRSLVPFLLAYGRTREEVVEALLPAMRDSSSAVRNNAMRVLWQTQRGASKALVPLAPVLRALHGPSLTDRNKGSVLLGAVVEKDASLRLAALKDAGPVLLEMVTMRQRTDREGALLALRALAGRDLGEDPQAWRGWVAETLAGAGAGEAARK
ncbi:HEAT repeat domain-containing protein [Archangium minus]|uniref:HEAT repeat domain-containing protein n=1 Tax=Archangium minus TaxID=83450 RepID=A0ABY9WW94_9BACT|nr:HEAT repeat domain-containing protein [Archangium minus]